MKVLWNVNVKNKIARDGKIWYGESNDVFKWNLEAEARKILT